MASLPIFNCTDRRSAKHIRTLIVLVLAACSAPGDRGVPASRRPSPPAVEKNIYIDDAIASNPVVIRGRARTFENNVVLRIRDERGETLAEDFATSAGEIGHHNPFTAEVWLTRDPGRQITVQAFEYSAKDGSVQSLDSRTLPYAIDPIVAKFVFPVEDCTRFEEFGRTVPKTPAMARLLVEILLAGPTEAEKARGATSPFPQGSDVKSVILRDGVLTVDFNQTLSGSCAATALTRTLSKLPNVKRVVIL